MTAKTTTKTTKPDMPKVVDVEEMPKPKRGRQSTIDLSPFVDLISDFDKHAIEDVDDKKKREKFSRYLRAAAKQAGLEVETTYQESESRLYFRGWPQGEAPARGRRSKSTRNE